LFGFRDRITRRREFRLTQSEKIQKSILLPPKHLASLAVHTDEAVGFFREKQTIANKNGRRVAPFERRLPRDVLLRIPFQRRFRVWILAHATVSPGKDAGGQGETQNQKAGNTNERG
jgi:hypothetical protein